MTKPCLRLTAKPAPSAGGRRTMTDAECDHCGIPSPDHSGAAQNGGMMLVRGTCVVCRDYKEEYGEWP